MLMFGEPRKMEKRDYHSRGFNVEDFKSLSEANKGNFSLWEEVECKRLSKLNIEEFKINVVGGKYLSGRNPYNDEGINFRDNFLCEVYEKDRYADFINRLPKWVDYYKDKYIPMVEAIALLTGSNNKFTLPKRDAGYYDETGACNGQEINGVVYNNMMSLNGCQISNLSFYNNAKRFNGADIYCNEFTKKKYIDEFGFKVNVNKMLPNDVIVIVDNSDDNVLKNLVNNNKYERGLVFMSTEQNIVDGGQLKIHTPELAIFEREKVAVIDMNKDRATNDGSMGEESVNYIENYIKELYKSVIGQ